MANLTAGVFAIDMRQPFYGVPYVADSLVFLDGFEPVREEVVAQTSTYFRVNSYDAQNRLVIVEGTGDLLSGTLNSVTETITTYQVRLNLAGNMYVDPVGDLYGWVSDLSAYRTTDNSLLARLADIDPPLDFTWADDLSDPNIFAGDDVLQGSPNADYLIGHDGADTILGGGGDDTIESGQGSRAAPERLAVSNPTPDGAQADGSSSYPAISGNGRTIAFASFAGNLTTGDGDGWQDVFVKDTEAGILQLASAPAPGGDTYGFSDGPVAISDNGRYVAFSYAGNLLPGLNTSATGYLFVRDLESGELTCVSLMSGGEAPNGSNWFPSLSADGRYVSFMTYATNLLDSDTNSDYDIVVRDTVTGTLIHASTSKQGEQANGASYWPSVSGDGRFVAFASGADNLVPNDGNANWDTFVKDLWTGDVVRASTTGLGEEGNGSSGGIPPSISADGRFVTFASDATNLVPGDVNGRWDVFLKDLQTGAISLVSCAGDGQQGDGDSYYSSVSGDGRYVVFSTNASNLLHETSGTAWPKLFVKDVLTGDIAPVVPSDGNPLWLGNDLFPVISTDGRYIAFSSESGALTSSDTNYQADIFRFENPFMTAVAPDLLDGGSGLDESRYPGMRSQYAATRQANGDVIVSGPQGADVLHDVERAVFSDLALGFDIDGTGGKAYRLYKAAFDREPDAGGLGFWMYYLDRGFDFVTAADNFLNSDEFRAMYGPNPTNEDYVRLLYLHVLQREPEGAGYQFWLDAMANKDGAFGHAWTRGEVLTLFSESQENQDNVIGLIGDGFEYLPWSP